MSQQENLQIARQLLAGIAKGATAEELAAPFAADVSFEIAGDTGALPWIRRQIGRAAAFDFFRDSSRLIEHLRFDVEATLADDERAVILGELASRIRATGRTVESAFAIILTVHNGQIGRFQLLEDTFAVSRAARTSCAPLT